MKTLAPLRTIRINTLLCFEMCFPRPKPLKITSIQSNHIKEGYKTHTCHDPIATWQKNTLIYNYAGHHLLSLKLRFVQEGAP
jgi:hypothetical protein